MIKALIRFVFFEMPLIFISGLTYILFEKVEITGCVYTLRKQWRPDIKRQVLEKYLDDCFKLVQDKEKGKNRE